MDAAEDQHSVKGCYVLVVVSEPVSEDDKQLILQRLNKGFLSWDIEATGCDLTGLENVCANVKDSKDAHDSDVLIQYSTESLGVEVLVNPPVSTLKQCMKNLLASSTGHRHLIHSGYTFAGSGSWILQNGTFSLNDFLNAFQDAEVHKGCTIHVHCIAEGEWNSKNLEKDAFSKVAKVFLNPSDRIDHLPGAQHLIDCLSNVLNSHSLDEIMEPSPLVGNVRFNSPTLYLFPAGDGDCSLFGVNGFNMLVDGGFSRKPCSWEFIRHLDRVDAVLVTRLNENNLCGLSTLMKRKAINNSSPEVGYVFCNIAENGAPSPVSSEELQKDKNDLLISIVGEGHKFVHTLNELNLKPHQCWRAGSAEPCVLYHKVGQGTLEMYVLSPPKGSKEVKDFIQEWSSYKEKFSKVKTGLKHKSHDVSIPLSHATSICALVVWRPADPKESITRILLPGSAPQSKIFESLELLKNLDILKQPTVTKASLNNIIMAKPKSKLETPPTKTSVPNRKNTASPSLSVSSVASRNGDIGILKKEIKKDNKEIKKDNKEIKKDNKEIKKDNKEIKKDNKEIKKDNKEKKDVKKDNKEIKSTAEKKSVAKAAPKKVESSPPQPKPIEAKKVGLVKKSTATPKKDTTKPTTAAKISEKPEVKKTTTSKASESKIAKEITNKKVAETKTAAKPKPKTSTGKVATKTEKSKAGTKVTGKVTKTTAAVAAAAAAAATVTATVAANSEESKEEVVKVLEQETQEEAKKVELLENGPKEDEQEGQKVEQVAVPQTPPPEAASPAPSETISLTPSDTLSSAPMETVSPTPLLPETVSPGEEKGVNEIKEVDDEVILVEQEASKSEINNLENEEDVEQENTLIDQSIEDTPIQVTENENYVEKEALCSDNKENEVPTEVVSSTDMTSSFIEEPGSADLMTSSFIKENDSIKNVVDETFERSSAIVSEAVPFTVKENVVESQEHDQSSEEHYSPNKYELENQSEELKNEIIDMSEPVDLIKQSEHIPKNEIVEDSEKVLPQDGETFPQSDVEHVTETCKQEHEDIDSFLAGATMEGSICAGIPIHDEKNFTQDESDFNANNQLKEKEEQIKQFENDNLDAALVETLVDEDPIEESTVQEIIGKFDSETAFQSEIVVDEIPTELSNEHLEERNLGNGSEKCFTEKDNDDSDDKNAEERQTNKELNDENHADISSEDTAVDSVKENYISEEIDLDKQEIASDLMSTSLIGETEFGLHKETSEDDGEIQNQNIFTDEEKERDFDYLREDKFVADEIKVITGSENSQIKEFDHETNKLPTEKVFDENELGENTEVLKDYGNVDETNDDASVEEIREDGNVEDIKEDGNVEEIRELGNMEEMREYRNIEEMSDEENISDTREGGKVGEMSEDEYSEEVRENEHLEEMRKDGNVEQIGEDGNVEVIRHSETYLGVTESVPKMKYDGNNQLIHEHEKNNVEIEYSRSPLQEQMDDGNLLACKDMSSEIIESDTNLHDFEDHQEAENVCSDIITEKDSTKHIAYGMDHKYIDDDFENKDDENYQDEMCDKDQPDEVARKESTVSIVLECDKKDGSDENRRESYAESEDDVDINRYMVKTDAEFADQDRLNVKVPSRGYDSDDDDDVVKSPTPHAIVDYAGQLDDNVQDLTHKTTAISGLESNLEAHDLDRDSDNIENYTSENKQDFNEKDRDSAEDEEMIRHPTPPEEKQFYENIGISEGQDNYDEMRDPISQHFISSPSFKQTSEIIDDPLYEEPEGSDSERLESPVVEQPVFGNVGEADFPELVNVSGGTTPSEPQSPKFNHDSKYKNNALNVEVMDALSEHDISDTSLHSPLCKDEQNVFDVPCESNLGAVDLQKEKGFVQQELAGSFEDIKEQVNANDPDIVNEMTTSGYTLDDISSSVLSSETQCSTVVTSESFSSSVVTSEFTAMQSSMYEQFYDDQDPVLDDICVGDEKHEQESSKEIISHPTATEPFDHCDNEQVGEQHHDFLVEDLKDAASALHPDFGNDSKEVMPNHDNYVYNHENTGDKSTNLQFSTKEDQQPDPSYEHPDSDCDDHRTTDEKDIDLKFAASDDNHLVSDSQHPELHHSEERADDTYDEEGKFALSSSNPNGHYDKQLLTSDHEDINHDSSLPQLEAKPFGMAEIQSNHWQDTTNNDPSNPLNSSSEFSEISQSNLKVEQEYPYSENARLQSASPEDNIMENDSSPDVPSPAEPEIPFSHILDQKKSVQPDTQNNFGNENNFAHDRTEQDGFSSDNMNFPRDVASISSYDGRREDPYGHSDSDEDSSSIPGTVSPYAYTNKAYAQEEEEVDGNNIYKESLRIEQTSEIKSISFDGNNPQQLPDDVTLSSSTTTRMTYSPGFPDMSSADPNYDFRLEEWGKPMGLPTPPETAHNLVKKATKSSTLNKSLNKSNDKRSSVDNGKAGSPLIGSKTLSSPSKASLKSKAPAAASNSSPVYVDLAYVPHHGDPDYCDVEFFKKVRARYYVLSGINPSKEVLNALLEAKKSWKEDLEVTIIPTYETDTLGYWMAQNQETLTANSIEVAPSASRCTVNLQDHETRCSAYRLEF